MHASCGEVESRCLQESMEAINCALEKMSYIGAHLHVESDATFLKFLGKTESALSGQRLERKSVVSDKHLLTPGRFVFYRDTENPNSEYRLVQCLSPLNPASECFALTVKIVNCKINLSEYSVAAEEWDEKGYALNKKQLTIGAADGAPAKHSILVSKSDSSRIVVFQKMDKEGDKAKCTEYTSEIKIIHVNEESCKLLTIGDASALGAERMPPPPWFIDDGLYDDVTDSSMQADGDLRTASCVGAFNACLCTFMAMYQREVSTGDSQLSIKRYFCNHPYVQKKMQWKVYCGRIDEGSSNEDHVFIEKPRVRWINDRYVPSRLTAEAKTLVDTEHMSSGGLLRFRGEHTHIFINIFIILQHWARHDAEKGPAADELLWRPDKIYSPYDRFYKPSFQNAHATELRTYDFTITQVLRNWVLGLFMHADHETTKTNDEGQRRQDMKTMLILFLKQGFGELNNLLKEDTGFPTPIFAGIDMNKSQEYEDYKSRAIVIMKNAVATAFPLFEPGNLTPAGEIIQTELLVAHIIDQSFKERVQIIPSLMTLATTLLTGMYYPYASDAYSAIQNIEKSHIVLPYMLRKGDLLLIYDTEGVALAYFHSLIWLDRISMLRNELIHFEENSLHLLPAIERKYREKQFQFYAPAIQYTTEREGRPEPTVYVRDMFNVYVVNR